MRYVILSVLIFSDVYSCKNPNTTKAVCSESFFKCARECSAICERTINRAYEFGKCYTICNSPCRKEHCSVEQTNQPTSEHESLSIVEGFEREKE